MTNSTKDNVIKEHIKNSDRIYMAKCRHWNNSTQKMINWVRLNVPLDTVILETIYFYRSDDPISSQNTEGGWLVIQTGLNLTRLTSPLQ